MRIVVLITSVVQVEAAGKNCCVEVNLHVNFENFGPPPYTYIHTHAFVHELVHTHTHAHELVHTHTLTHRFAQFQNDSKILWHRSEFRSEFGAKFSTDFVVNLKRREFGEISTDFAVNLKRGEFGEKQRIYK